MLVMAMLKTVRSSSLLLKLLQPLWTLVFATGNSAGTNMCVFFKSILLFSPKLLRFRLLYFVAVATCRVKLWDVLTVHRDSLLGVQRHDRSKALTSQTLGIAQKIGVKRYSAVVKLYFL
jgi:hypothetical protein